MANSGLLQFFSYVNFEELESTVHAFKKIYSALHAAQDNHTMLKSNFLEGKETLPARELARLIKEHTEEKPKSRTAKAWTLAEKHHQNCHAENTELFNAIYLHATKAKHYMGMTFFNKTNASTILHNSLVQNAFISDHTGWKIFMALNHNAKLCNAEINSRAIKVN